MTKQTSQNKAFKDSAGKCLNLCHYNVSIQECVWQRGLSHTPESVILLKWKCRWDWGALYTVLHGLFQRCSKKNLYVWPSERVYHEFGYFIPPARSFNWDWSLNFNQSTIIVVWRTLQSESSNVSTTIFNKIIMKTFCLWSLKSTTCYNTLLRPQLVWSILLYTWVSLEAYISTKRYNLLPYHQCKRFLCWLSCPSLWNSFGHNPHLNGFCFRWIAFSCPIQSLKLTKALLQNLQQCFFNLPEEVLVRLHQEGSSSVLGLAILTLPLRPPAVGKKMLSWGNVKYTSQQEQYTGQGT